MSVEPLRQRRRYDPTAVFSESPEIARTLRSLRGEHEKEKRDVEVEGLRSIVDLCHMSVQNDATRSKAAHGCLVYSLRGQGVLPHETFRKLFYAIRDDKITTDNALQGELPTEFKGKVSTEKAYRILADVSQFLDEPANAAKDKGGTAYMFGPARMKSAEKAATLLDDEALALEHRNGQISVTDLLTSIFAVMTPQKID